MAEPTSATPAPDTPLAPPSVHDGGAVAGSPVAMANEGHRLLPCTVEVPRHAIGHVIGTKPLGKNLKALRSIMGVTSCTLMCDSCGSKCEEEGCFRLKVLTAKGTVAEALQLMEQRVTHAMGLADEKLHNNSRQHHTHDLRPNGSALRPHDVHKAVPKTPRPKAPRGGASTAAVAVERAADESGATSMAEPALATPAPDTPLAPPSVHDGGAVAGSPVAMAKKKSTASCRTLWRCLATPSGSSLGRRECTSKPSRASRGSRFAT